MHNGRLINWQYNGDPVTFRVTSDNRLEQVDADTMGELLTRDEWIAREKGHRIRTMAAYLGQLADLGMYDESGIEDALEVEEAQINSEAGIVFAAEEWLDSLSPQPTTAQRG